MSSTGMSSQPAAIREAWRSVWRMHRVPMKIPRSRLRSTAYQRVDSSPGPWIGCQGASGLEYSSAWPASTSWERVATRPS